MEIPDVVAVNKGDHQEARATVRDIRAALSLVPGEEQAWIVPVVLTQAIEGDGVGELLSQVGDHRRHQEASGDLAERRRGALRAEVLALAVSATRRRIESELSGDAAWSELIAQVGERRLDPLAAARMLLETAPDGHDG
jgi:LAO/AO transport system kinase